MITPITTIPTPALRKLMIFWISWTRGLCVTQVFSAGAVFVFWQAALEVIVVLPLGPVVVLPLGSTVLAMAADGPSKVMKTASNARSLLMIAMLFFSLFMFLSMLI